MDDRSARSAADLVNTYCVVDGLTSPNGRRHNGNTCFVIKPDPENATRVAVLFTYDIGSSDGKTISLKIENLKPKFGVEVRASPLGGLGLFATRDFAAGEIVFEERAFLVIPKDKKPLTGNWFVEGLSAPAKEVLSSLTHYASNGDNEWASRVARNSIVDEVGASALSPLICRINHGCNALTSNNVWWYCTDSANKPRVLTAQHAIKKGDELLADYTDLTLDAFKRRATLAASWRISGCRCALCNPSLTLSFAISQFDDYVRQIEDLSPLASAPAPARLRSADSVNTLSSLAKRAMKAFEAMFRMTPIIANGTATCDLALHNMSSRLHRAVNEALGGLLTDSLCGQMSVSDDEIESLFSNYKAVCNEALEAKLTFLHGNASHPYYVAEKQITENNLRDVANLFHERVRQGNKK